MQFFVWRNYSFKVRFCKFYFYFKKKFREIPELLEVGSFFNRINNCPILQFALYKAYLNDN